MWLCVYFINCDHNCCEFEDLSKTDERKNEYSFKPFWGYSFVYQFSGRNSFYQMMPPGFDEKAHGRYAFLSRNDRTVWIFIYPEI